MTGGVALVLEGSFLNQPLKFGLFLVGLYLTGGCANSLNQFFERDIDAKMTRTAANRPLPMGLLTKRQALLFSIGIGSSGVILLAVTFNLLTGLLAVATILFYSLVYTLWLKPGTSENIVIGGIAGAMAPVGAWTAATGTVALMPWIMFLIVFLWTPPHFWSLALRFRDDYDRSELPMLPNVKGEKITLRRIFLYSLGLFVASLLPLAVNFSWLYLTTAVGLGLVFVYKAFRCMEDRNPKEIWGLFKYSIFYLFSIFCCLIIGGLN
jgi:protoheme IX farnesyltransferase